MSSRHVSPRGAAVTGALLIVLWVASWGLSYVSLGSWSLVVALLIAGAKGALVVLFFMETWSETASFNLGLLSAFSLIVVLISFVVGDVVTRGPPPLETPPVTYPLGEAIP